MPLECEQIVTRLAHALRTGVITEKDLLTAVKRAAEQDTVDNVGVCAVSNGVPFDKGSTDYSPWIHNKTGNVYFRLTPIYGPFDTVLNCTNANDNQEMVLYTDKYQVFVREKQEFLDRFTYAPWWG